MKKTALLVMSLLGAATIAGAANAADGCGRGAHRGPYGHCHLNHVGLAVAPGLVIGTYYPHHGYWDGQRYWEHRYHDHDRGGWRYR